MGRKKNQYQELVKNDPNFHDIRAKILLEAAQHLDQFSKETEVAGDFPSGVKEAATELRRMASNARRAHNKHQETLRKQREASEAKMEAFGYK